MHRSRSSSRTSSTARAAAHRPSARSTAQGSGFVIDGKEGLIVTNNHVIDGADEIIVNFSDGSKLKVEKVIGKDTKTDLALLKVIPKRPLAQVAFGASGGMKVGDWVMAIGNPFGLGGSVSVGIISAKQRDINTGPYDDYLQTDAAINKGNSGGPLFNMDGEVIGVNTAIISPTGFSVGIGFAVPSDVAVVVIDQLRLYGETRRGWLGVNIQSITDDLAESLRSEGEQRCVRLQRGAGWSSRQGRHPGRRRDPEVRRQGRQLDALAALDRGANADRQGGRRRGCPQGPAQDAQGGSRPARRRRQARSPPGVRVPPKSRNKGKEKDSGVQRRPRRALADRAGAGAPHR